MITISPDQIVTAPDRAAAALEAARDHARDQMLRALSEAAVAMTGPVPQVERDSWPTKAAAARAHLAGTATDKQQEMLAAEAAETGEAVDALVARVVANADAYEVAAARIAGIRRRIAAEVAAATTPAQIAAAMQRLADALAEMGG